MKIIQGLEDYSYQEICDIILDHINSTLEDNGYSADDLDIVEIKLHGSRLRGTARSDSDLDAVVEYSGNFREDDLFGLLNEDPLFIEDIQVDINPITESMSSYMNRSNAYDKQKRIEAGLEARVRKLENLLLKTHQLTESVADGDIEPVAKNKRYFNFLKVARECRIALSDPEWRSPKLCIITGQCSTDQFELDSSYGLYGTLNFKVQYSDTQFYLTVALNDSHAMEIPKFTGTTTSGEFYYKVTDIVKRIAKSNDLL